jgi:hypothetical protein
MAWILWTMVYLFNALDHSRPGPMPPERRRAVVIGACPAGISAAYHLGEHSLLLDQRDTLEDSHDRSNDFPMGTARGGAVGAESPAAEGQRPGVSPTERKALFISCSSSKLIHIERWRPPDHGSQPRDDEHSGPSSAMALIPLLRGEVRLGSCVVRISPSAHMLELADGHRIIYDKLLSAIPLAALARLVMHEVPGRVRCDEILRYWLGEHDVELADSATQDYFGDLDDFAAGRRVATLIEHALDLKFGRSPGRHGGGKLFEPRIVTAAPAMP